MEYNGVHIETFLEMIHGANKARIGWILCNIPLKYGESIGAHIQKCRRAGRLFCSRNTHLNAEKVDDLLNVHDVPEMFNEGHDDTPGTISAEEKWQREIVILDRVTPLLGSYGEKMRRDIEEFQENKTPEAIIANQLDKMDACVQAMAYEQRGYPRVRDFYPYTLNRLSNQVLINIFHILMRKQFENWSTSYYRYYTLLITNGNEEAYKEEMKRVGKEHGYIK